MQRLDSMPAFKRAAATLPLPVLLAAKRLRFFGWGRRCPVCGSWVRRFLDSGHDHPRMKQLGVISTGFARGSQCPVCYAKERQRTLVAYLREEAGIFRRPTKLLHVAPEYYLGKKLPASPTINYVCGDFQPERYPQLPMIRKLDLTAIDFPDRTFDMIICSHVLEHIPADRTAMAEMFRVLKPGGVAALMVPLSFDLEQTIEDPSVITPERRHELFGQHDHVRVYGRDFPDRLAAAGFLVREFNGHRSRGEDFARRWGLDRETLFEARRPPE
jgi:SAM-dependent methyltransferase